MTDDKIPVAEVRMDISFLQDRPEGIPDGGWVHTILSGVMRSTLVEVVGALEGDVPWEWDKDTKVRSLVAQMTVCCLIEQLCTTCHLLKIDKDVAMKAIEHGWYATKLDLASPDDASVGHA
jgi:hypothetical protein